MRGVGLLAALLLVVPLAAGCVGVDGSPAGRPSVGGTTSIPPRPRELTMVGVDPCSLLSTSQRSELELDGRPSSTTEESTLFGGAEPTCLISGFHPQALSVGVGIVTSTGIEFFTSRDLEATVTDVDVRGFPAVRVVPTRFQDYCSVFVGVAQGQLLDVQVADGGRQPPVSQAELCRRAEDVADRAVDSLARR